MVVVILTFAIAFLGTKGKVRTLGLTLLYTKFACSFENTQISHHYYCIKWYYHITSFIIFFRCHCSTLSISMFQEMCGFIAWLIPGHLIRPMCSTTATLRCTSSHFGLQPPYTSWRREPVLVLVVAVSSAFFVWQRRIMRYSLLNGNRVGNKSISALNSIPPRCSAEVGSRPVEKRGEWVGKNVSANAFLALLHQSAFTAVSSRANMGTLWSALKGGFPETEFTPRNNMTMFWYTHIWSWMRQ